VGEGPDVQDAKPLGRDIVFPGPDISWREEMKEFAAAIMENREPIGSGYDGVMANRLVGAVYESARRNAPVRLGPFEKGE